MQLRNKNKIIYFFILGIFFLPSFVFAGDYAVQISDTAEPYTVNGIDVAPTTDLDFTDDFIIEVRYRQDDCTPSNAVTGLVAQNDSYNWNTYTIIENDAGCDGVHVYIDDGAGNNLGYDCPFDTSDGEFHTVVWTRNGQAFTCEIDGNDVGVFSWGSGTLGVSATGTQTMFGNWDNDTQFAGAIDYVKITIDGVLQGFWDMEENTGTTVGDSINGNDGVFDGDPYWIPLVAEITGFRLLSASSGATTTGLLATAVKSNIGSVWVVVLLSISVFLSFYVIQQAVSFFPDSNRRVTQSRSRRRK